MNVEMPSILTVRCSRAHSRDTPGAVRLRFTLLTSVTVLAALMGGGCRTAPEMAPVADMAPVPKITVGPQLRPLPIEPGFIDPPMPAVQLASFADAASNQLATLAIQKQSQADASSLAIRRAC